MGLERVFSKGFQWLGGLRTGGGTTCGMGSVAFCPAAQRRDRSLTEILLIFKPCVASAHQESPQWETPGSVTFLGMLCMAPTRIHGGDLRPHITQVFTGSFVTAASSASRVGRRCPAPRHVPQGTVRMAQAAP